LEGNRPEQNELDPLFPTFGRKVSKVWKLFGRFFQPLEKAKPLQGEALKPGAAGSNPWKNSAQIFQPLENLR